MKQLVIEEIPIEVERKRIKNMYLKVLPPDGRVHISAPVRMSEETIRNFVLSRIDWIRLQQEKIQKRHVHEDIEYITGDIVHYLGKPYRLIIISHNTPGCVSLEGDTVILETRPASTTKMREDIIHTWYRQSLNDIIPGLMDKWEKIIGVKSSSFYIRNMKTRWGTCNVRNKRICFNLQLAKKPPKCLEYVVVHELVHLLEGSHNRIFKGYMDHFLPDWRQIKKEMNGSE